MCRLLLAALLAAGGFVSADAASDAAPSSDPAGAGPVLAPLPAADPAPAFPWGTRSEDLDAIRKAGRLRVITRNAATTWYENHEGEPEGFEYELTRAFAAELGVAVEFIARDGVPRALEALGRREGHLAAAGITATPLRSETFRFSAPYQHVQQQVVCHGNVRADRMREPGDLSRVRVTVPKDTSYDQRLTALVDAWPDLRWETTTDRYTEELLRDVAEKRIDCTVADSNLVAVHQRFFLDLRPAFALGGEESLAWAFNRDQPALAQAAGDFLKRYAGSGQLQRLLDKYYGHLQTFDPHDTRVFLDRVRTRLPKCRNLFERAGARFGFSWRLLAAVAYQESQWNPQAESPTGVRGMMMLTRRTADSLGVKNRLSAQQSIFAGAKHLRDLVNRQPAFLDDETRLWMALASYNVGYLHLRDARALAVVLEKDPNSWSDLETVLPLLSQPKYYRRLAHGYARGWEPVIYVKRVRNYRDLLERHVADH